jgi:hypothetical protein
MACSPTIINRPGANGGPGATYRICCSKTYAQTLFLGCSVKSFNCSLGWGGEASRLSVELAYDNCAYPNLVDINGNVIPRPNGSDEYTQSLLNNNFAKDENGNNLVPGKVFYQPQGNKVVSKYHYGPDPGFYADMPNPEHSVDIIGCPVYFKYNDFEFSGIVKNWENTGNSGGTKTYTVSIESPSFLLSQTQMILGDYAGAIFVKSDSFPPFGFSKFAYGDYKGKIAEQNIPNVINVYGYLEDITNVNSNQPLDDYGIPKYQFGASGRNDEGLLAIPIIMAVQDLLNAPQPYTKQKIMRYSPFGRMAGITPKLKISAEDINNTYTMGLVQPFLDPIGLKRILYTIDITQINKDNTIPAYYRINQNYMSILDFVSNICDNTGKEFYISLDFQIENSIMYPRITVNTVTRLDQPPDGAVQSYIDYLSDLGISVSSYSKGEEYNNTRPVRSMYIGGKQQRLYQVRNNKYALSQWVLRYNAHKNMFTTVNHSTTQDYRFPNLSSLRNPLHYNVNTAASSFGRVELPSDFYQLESALTRKTINRGNYLPERNVGGIGIFPDSVWYPSSDSDSICPYFGTNDITGIVRKVYSHRTGFIVEFTTSEIGLAINRSPALNETVGISESEIRAAMAGLDEYVGFMSAVIDDAIAIGGPQAGNSALQSWSKVLLPLLGPGALRTMAQGIAQTSNKINNSQSGSSSVPINPRTSFMTDNPIFSIVVKLQEYLKKIGDEYYGRKFMVSIPSPDFWRDSRIFSPPIQIGNNFDGSPIFLTEGTNKTYYAYEPADFAWEEAGNMVDDMLVVGNAAMDLFTKEDGTIEPIMGYINNAQYNYSKEFNKALWDATRTNGNDQFFQFWKYEAYRNAGIVYGNDASTNFWEPLLKFPGSEQYTVPRNQASTDPFQTTIPAERSYKTYLKAKVEKELQTYVTSFGTVVAKVIVSTDPVQINPINPQALSIRTLAVEYLANDYTGVFGLRAGKILALADNFVQANSDTFNANNVLSQNKENQQFTNMAAVPKMAVPAFAAVPLVFNTSVYGPWISAPDLVINNIFGNQTNPLDRLENLVGGVKLEINPDLVPWNYGGMRVLDEAALLMVGQDNDYQTKSETGQLTVYGTPEFNLGNELKAAAFAFRGPTVNNIQVQISESGPTTTYTFRTFTRKFTLFNKESADRLKAAGQSSIKMSRELRQQARTTTERLRGLSTSASFSSYDFTGSKLTAYSPMSVLVGFSSPYVSPKTQLNPGFYQPNNFSGDSIKQLTTVSLQDTRELTQEFDHLYGSKAFMSLDGLLSPISFYPTLNNSTAAYKRYAKAGCPICGGTKQFVFNNKTLYCDFCSDQAAGTEAAQNNTGGGGKLPPFILSNQADETILQDPNKLSTLLAQGFITKRINYVNLNPIIMPVGELRNKYAQQTDFNAHHIDIIGRSNVPMLGSLSITDNLAINQNGLEFLDQNNSLSDVDWNSYAFDQEAGLEPKFLQMNHRFLGLRGPLVMAGWGFDTEGYPVPNASGEPKQLDNEGYPKRISSLEDLQGGFQNYSGVILGKNQEIKDGKWTTPKKENEFMKGWGLRPDTWPVGPIDLRWDESRRVWTAASDQYRLVDVQLEDNLLSPFPARGYLHAVDKNDPLPSGLRRMVFVKDSSNIYGAPRGAKLLCYYDQSTGFYEPVSKQNIMASGYVQSNGTAIVYNSYEKGYDEYTGEPVTPDPLQIEFNNFLNFPLTTENQPGLFVFMNNEWVLMSTYSCGN